MGYPKRDIAMTNVHGQPQQGGYLPAEIWHAYMAAVTEGQGCVEFPQPKEQISYKPFYGKFATTGQTELRSFEAGATASPRARHKRAGRGGNGESTGGRGDRRSTPTPLAPPPPPPPPAGPPVAGTGGAPAG
jgi:hypothetical protein